jgi:hypothetical protein
MDEQLVTEALQAATRDVRPSAELDARVAAIVNQRGRRRRSGWLVATAAAVVMVVLGVTAVRTVDSGDQKGQVVTAGPDQLSDDPRWLDSARSPLGRRQEATFVWTGREATVWGGIADSGAPNSRDIGTADGAAWDPSTDTWRMLPPAPIAPRYSHVGVWTGQEMIVWGGVVNPSARPANGLSPNDGAAYNPVSNTWRPIARSPLPLPSRTTLSTGQQAVWSGTEMLVWGVFAEDDYDRSGAAYNPSTDAWRPLPALPGKATPKLLWTSPVVVAVFGTVVSTLDAEVLDPQGGGWKSMPPLEIDPSNGLWMDSTGSELLVISFRPVGFPPPLAARTSSARYRPGDASWRPLALPPGGAEGGGFISVWTGREHLLASDASASAYDPGRDRWRTIPTPDLRNDDQSIKAVQGAGGALIWIDGRILRFVT